MLTQHQKIIEKLDDSRWHCSNELRDLFVPEYRSRINELRKRGYEIKALRCNLHKHQGNSQMWRLFVKPASQNAPRQEINTPPVSSVVEAFMEKDKTIWHPPIKQLNLKI